MNTSKFNVDSSKINVTFVQYSRSNHGHNILQCKEGIMSSHQYLDGICMEMKFAWKSDHALISKFKGKLKNLQKCTRQKANNKHIHVHLQMAELNFLPSVH